MTGLDFRPIQLDLHFSECQRLRALAYLASYDSLNGFAENYGENYRERLAQKISQVPEGNCHVWFAEHIIGQMEVKMQANPAIGYINLLVLQPEYRGQGIGSRMVDYLADVFRGYQKSLLQLSVTESNLQARQFYQTNGWVECARRADKPNTLLLQKAL